MRVMSLDLELTQPSCRIIEVGIAVGDVITKEIYFKQSIMVNPHEQLTDYIKKLTSITQADVDSGVSVEEAYKIVKDTYLINNCQMNIITWGGNDIDLLKTQAGNPEDFHKTFGRRYFDVKTFLTGLYLAKGQKLRGGLAKCMAKEGIYFKGIKHRADDDAYNTLALLFHLLSVSKKSNS